MMKSFGFSTSGDGAVDNLCRPTSSAIFARRAEPPVYRGRDYRPNAPVDNRQRFRAP
jgi:hypothetical protein